MSGSVQTRERFIEATAELLQERGYHGTGINEIIKRSGAPSGSLYHFFPDGKEELTVAALEAAGRRVGEHLKEAFAPKKSAPAIAREFIGVLRNQLVESKFGRGCPIATVALEVAATNDRIQSACHAAYTRWAELIETALADRGIPRKKAREAAAFILSTVEGALVFSRARRDTGYIDIAARKVDQELRRLAKERDASST